MTNNRMVTIRKKRTDEGFVYEVDNFATYARVLRDRGIPVPRVKYRIFISHETEKLIHEAVADWEAQVALFFRLGPQVEYRIVSE